MATIPIPGILQPAESSPDLSTLPQFYLMYRTLPAGDLVRLIDAFRLTHDDLASPDGEETSEELGIAAIDTGGSVLAAFLPVLPEFGAVLQAAYITVLGGASAFYFVLKQRADAQKTDAERIKLLAEADLSRAKAEQVQAESLARKQTAVGDRLDAFAKIDKEIKARALRRFEAVEKKRSIPGKSQTLALSDGEAVVISKGHPTSQGEQETQEYLEYVYDDFRRWMYDKRLELSLDMSDFVTLWLEARGFEFLRNVWGLYLRFVVLLETQGYVVTSVLSYHDYCRMYRLQRVRR